MRLWCFQHVKCKPKQLQNPRPEQCMAGPFVGNEGSTVPTGVPYIALKGYTYIYIYLLLRSVKEAYLLGGGGRVLQQDSTSAPESDQPPGWAWVAGDLQPREHCQVRGLASGGGRGGRGARGGGRGGPDIFRLFCASL